jgi:hypothetical protein
MYVRGQALTFADLAKAVQRDAGLGQTSLADLTPIDQLANLPLTSTGEVGYSAADQAISTAGIPYQTPALNSTPSVTNFNWGLLAAAVAGVFLFAAVAGKK